jgi:hypothetical protein
MNVIDGVPVGWRPCAPDPRIPFEMFEQPLRGLKVARTVETYEGQRWLHVSLSRRSQLPSYEDMKLVKHAFIGDDRAAYQVFARAAEHVNVHEFCLHLWCPLDRDPFPSRVQADGR